MPWSKSGVFRRTLLDNLDGTWTVGLTGVTYRIALFNNSITPDSNVSTQVLCAYNGESSQWVNTSNEIANKSGFTNSGTTGWPVGGPTLASPVLSTSSGTVSFSAANVAQTAVTTVATSGGSAGSGEVAPFFGALIYVSPGGTSGVGTNQGLCYVYFNSTEGFSTDNGSLTISWPVNGIFRITGL